METICLDKSNSFLLALKGNKIEENQTKRNKIIKFGDIFSILNLF